MISFSNVTKTYGEKFAVRDFSLEIPTGRITVLMGLSGSGKTTLIRMINKMVIADSGTVMIDGKDTRDLDSVALRRSIGYVLQEVGLLPHKTVIANVALIAKISGQAEAEAKQNAVEMLNLVGIDESFHDRYPSQLSGGQQQRVGVARALAIKPAILLMDEPFGAVDPIVREELQSELLRIQAELSLTIVLVTHDRYEAMRLADQLVVLSDEAQIELAGSPSEIKSKPQSEFASKLLGLNR